MLVARSVLSLLSLEFIALAGAAIFWVRFVPGPLRGLGFFAASCWYASQFASPLSLVCLAAFAAAGYGGALLAARSSRWTPAVVFTLVAAFVYLRGYDLLDFVLPGDWRLEFLELAGLSYLLFKMIHVVVDCSSGLAVPLRFGWYALYCTNFTAFLLGPIQRYPDFVRQWRGEQEPLESGFEPHLDAVNRILRGMLKKFVFAERVAVFALLPGAEIADMPTLEVLMRAWVFYVYLYLDFSGYCDIMIGIGSLMGVRPPENFRFPFLAPNVSEYWLRVHRSLTTWLTDYIFTPLFAAGLRFRDGLVNPLLAGSVAMGTTMLVAGLWHGTTLNFLLFGAVHAVYLVSYRVIERVLQDRLGRRGLRELRERRSWRVAGTVVTLILTASAYVFFVLEPDQIGVLLGRMGGIG
jgi:alginate O-acetyltransferase complex protein AlgI